MATIRELKRQADNYRATARRTGDRCWNQWADEVETVIQRTYALRGLSVFGVCVAAAAAIVLL